MTQSAMAVPVISKQHQSDDIDKQSSDTHPDEKVGVVNLFFMRESPERFHQNREAQRY